MFGPVQTVPSPNVLRDRLASELASNGDAMVVGKRSISSALAFELHAYHENRMINLKTDYGAVGDGVTDDTAKWNTALSIASLTGIALYVPSSTYLVKSVDSDTADQPVINILSNTKIIFETGVTIQLDTTTSGRYKILNIKDVSNVVIDGNGANIIGDRVGPSASLYEHGHGLNIEGSTNVTVKNLNISNCWGDGRYIGSGALGYSENLLFENIDSFNNRRQALSVISAKNFTDNNGRYRGTNGTSPACGVDIEPDLSTEYLENIVFNDPIFSDNDGGGFFVYLLNLQNANRNISINVNRGKSIRNCNDVVSHGIYSGFEVRRVKDTASAPVPSGIINLNECESIDDQYGGFGIVDKSSLGPLVRWINPVVMNPNQSGAIASINQSNGYIVKSEGNAYTEAPGGLEAVNPLCIDNDGNLVNVALAQFAYQAATATPQPRITDVMVINPKMKGPGVKYNGSNNCNLITIDDKLMPEVDAGGSITILPRHLGQITTNAGQVGGTWVFTLPSDTQVGVGVVFEFVCRVAQVMRIDPNGTDSILPSGGAGKYLQTSTPGSSIKLKKISSTEWQVLGQVGTWTFEP